jgi:AcrR family transcriptional regulator
VATPLPEVHADGGTQPDRYPGERRRLQVDERRRQLIEAGSALFAEHAYEEISMREVAQAAGVSKPLLYHYFPSKIELFKAAVAEKAAELARLIEPSGEGTPLEELTLGLDAYLAWIEDNARRWSKLMQSATTLPEARQIVEGVRQRTMELVLSALAGRSKPRPALHIAIKGWLGYMDAAILDWTEARDLPREKLRELLVAAFAAALAAAQQTDPKLQLHLDG